MRIAIVVRRLTDPGGAERSQFRLAEYLRRNHDVDEFGLYGTPSADRESLGVRQTIDNRIPAALNTTYRFLDARRKGYAQLAKRDYELVITQHGGIVIGQALKSRQGVPHVAFVHDHEILGRESARRPNPVAAVTNIFGRHIRRIVEQRWYERTDGVFVPSEYMADQLRQYGLNPVVMYALVPADEFRRSVVRPDTSTKDDTPRTPDTPPKILHVTPKPHKGIETTLEIAATQRDWEFLLVGRFDDERLAERASAAPNVKTLGHITDIRDSYRQADVLLVPSQWAEPGATVTIEAGMGGVPPVVANRGGLPELVADERQRVSDETVDDYIKAITTVLDDYDELSRLAENYAYERRAELQVERLKSTLLERCDLDL